MLHSNFCSFCKLRITYFFYCRWFYASILRHNQKSHCRYRRWSSSDSNCTSYWGEILFIQWILWKDIINNSNKLVNNLLNLIIFPWSRTFLWQSIKNIHIKFSLQGSGTDSTVFKGSKKPYQKECVLIIDHESGQVTLEKLSYNVQLKKTRFVLTIFPLIHYVM